MFLAFPRKVDRPLLSQANAPLAAEMLRSCGDLLKQCLLLADILYLATDEAVDVEGHVAACRDLHEHQLDRFLKAVGLGIFGNMSATTESKYLFSLWRYNDLFSRTVYVMRQRPDGNRDGWPYLRCTCLPMSTMLVVSI